MLDSLVIQNVVLIEKAVLQFKNGLTVFTGETGAGKSILIDALNLALGGRADTGLVRYGSQGLSVAAVFTPAFNQKVMSLLQEQDIELEEENLILKRTLSVDGKGKAFVNDMPVSVTFLRKLGSALAEIHGQFLTQNLLDFQQHKEVLDRYARLTEEKKTCTSLYHEWKKISLEKKNLVLELQQIEREQDYWMQVLEDLSSLRSDPMEEENLSSKRKELMNKEKIVQTLEASSQALSSSNNGILSLCYKVQSSLEKIKEYCPEKTEVLLEKINNALEHLLDIEAFLEQEKQSFETLESLEEIEKRLFLLKDMSRKYRISISEFPDFIQKAQDKLEALQKSDDKMKTLEVQEELAFKAYKACCETLHTKREQAAQNLMQEIMQELPELKLNHAVFVVDIQRQDEGDESGFDKVMFMASTNKGVPLAPLSKIASGGELSRFMLAFKLHLAKTDEIPVMIFDEVDTGISGATSDAVGKRLKKLAQEAQVIVITHSPQVAAFGHQHMTVSKHEVDGKIISTVDFLSPEERSFEIARMLSGEKITQDAFNAAKALLKEKYETS